MPFHPKIVEAGNEATGARDRMIAWCCGNRTDGLIPVEIVKAICVRPGLIRHMIAHKMLDVFDAKTGTKLEHIKGKRMDKNQVILFVHNHLKWNPSAEESEALSKVRSESGAKGAAVKWGKGHGNGHSKSMPDPDPDPTTIDQGNGSGLMLGEINSRLEAEFGARGFISSKWQPKLRPHLPYTADELESAIMEAKAADPDDANGGLIAAILIRYRRPKRAGVKPVPLRTLKHIEPLERPACLGPVPDYSDVAEPPKP